MADLVNTPSLVTKLLDVIPSLIYPPPRKLFCHGVAVETTTPQAASPLTSKTSSIRSVNSGSDIIDTSVSSWSNINGTDESISSGSIAGFNGFNSSSSDKSASDIGASDFSVSETGNSVAMAASPLFQCPSLTPVLFCDAEGVSLSRNGELCILELHMHHRLHQRTYIIDIFALGTLAFAITSTDGRHTLKSILEDATVPKVFFDVRMDSVLCTGNTASRWQV